MVKKIYDGFSKIIPQVPMCVLTRMTIAPLDC